MDDLDAGTIRVLIAVAAADNRGMPDGSRLTPTLQRHNRGLEPLQIGHAVTKGGRCGADGGEVGHL